MMPVIYLIILLAYGILTLGFVIRNHIFILFASLLMFSLGVYILWQGIDVWRNFVTLAFGAITFGIAAYTSIRASLELMEGG